MTLTPDAIQEQKEGRKRASKMKPPKRKYIFGGEDIRKEFKITHVESNIPKNKWVKRERKRANAARNSIIKILRGNSKEKFADQK